MQIVRKFNKMVDDGKIMPSVYPETYHGLGDIPRAMMDIEAHRVYGRAIVTMPREPNRLQSADATDVKL